VVLGVVIAWFAGLFTEKIAPREVLAASGPAIDLSQFEPYEVQVREKPYIQEAIGTLRAASRTEISARILAPIQRIHVRAGDVVEEGQVLIELDRQAFEAQLLQAEAAVEAAKATLAEAQDRYDRAAKVRQTNPGAISPQEFNSLEAKLRAAEANRAKAEQARAEAEVQLSYTVIRAPKSGTIVDRWAEEGDMARPGTPLLSLYDQKSLRLEVPVMENLAAHIREGDRLVVHIDALNRQFDGVVDEKVPQAEAATRSFLIKVKLPPSDELYEGMFGRLFIPAGSRRHLCLHSGGIQRIGQLEFVRVWDRVTGKVERRFIKSGQRGYGDFVEVLSGLSPGELVLVPKELARAPMPAMPIIRPEASPDAGGNPRDSSPLPTGAAPEIAVPQG